MLIFTISAYPKETGRLQSCTVCRQNPKVAPWSQLSGVHNLYIPRACGYHEIATSRSRSCHSSLLEMEIILVDLDLIKWFLKKDSALPGKGNSK